MEFLSITNLFNQGRPYLLVIFVQFGYSVMSIIAKQALNQGMSPHVLVAYRMAVASTLIAPFALILERNSRPKMTLRIFAQITLLSLFEPVLDQNLFYTGMRITTATFVTAMCNILPAVTFVMACIFRFEPVDFRRLHFHAKVVGTLVTIGGAMLLTFAKGPRLNFPWEKRKHPDQSAHSAHVQDLIKGAVVIIFGCLSWSSFIILQATVLKSYPARLSLTALICTMGMVESAILTLAVEGGNTGIWSIDLDVKLLAAVYGGILSGVAYYVMGLLAREKGPVFLSASNPLSMVMVAILGSFFLNEITHIGRVIGAIVIVLGLYLVLWGKSKDQTSTTNSGGVTPCPQTARENGNIEMSNLDFVAINAMRVRNTEEPV